ncbi:hypothetical protein PT2222_40029 [Paraburkholderia tropica]
MQAVEQPDRMDGRTAAVPARDDALRQACAALSRSTLATRGFMHNSAVGRGATSGRMA